LKTSAIPAKCNVELQASFKKTVGAKNAWGNNVID